MAKKKAAAKAKDPNGTYTKFKCERKAGKFSKKEGKVLIRVFKRMPHDLAAAENARFESTGFWFEA